MFAVKIKPLSTNNAWKGRRFKTKEYKEYEEELLWLLPRTSFNPNGDYSVYYEFGCSNSRSDYDNFIKQFQDILCKKYGIDDSNIWEAKIKKVKVKKGDEYVKFDLKEIEI